MESSLRIAAELKNLEVVRRFVQETATTLKVDPEVIPDVLLAVTEMVTNIIVHGYRYQAGIIEIEVGRAADSLVVRLRDRARPFDPTIISPPDLTLSLDKRPFGGMGIYLTKQLMDEMTYRVMPEDGNELTLIKNISSAMLQRRKQMNITVEHVQGKVPVTILGIHGDLDGSNYQTLIAKAREVYNAGARYLLLDMSDLHFMSSSGLVALHSIAKLMRGEPAPDPESGWEAFHAIGRDQTSGLQQRVKLLSPQAQADRALDMTGMKQFFEIHADRETALASFALAMSN